MSEPSDVVDVIRAIAAGAEVNWAEVASTPADASVVAVLNELHIIARIAAVHGTTDDPEPDDASAEDRLQTWGPLTVVERVGAGRYGVVYRAWDSRLDREVALKLLRHGDAPRDADRPTIEEGRLLARVRHPNVVTVYGADRIEDRVGIWMEFVEGRTLEAIVRDEGPFDAVHAARVGVEIARGLSAVHRAGLLHRDVKAQNVMRQDDGRIMLMDFGTVHAAGEAAAGVVAGTPLYIAPDVLAGAPASPATDVYSLGIVLYHLVTGSYPVVAADLTGVRTAHHARQVTPLSVARGDLPRRFIEIVDQATAPDLAARIQTADDLQRALAAFVEAKDPLSARARRHRLAAAAAVVVAALAVGGAVVGLMANRWTPGGRTFQARDWLIVTNFDNRTGDDRLDGTVEYALERELKESAFVNVVPRERIDDTLRLMKLPLDTAIDRTRGLEVCLRDGGIRGLVTGRIEKFGSSYSIAAAVIDSRSKGRTLASVGVQAADEARILDAVHQLSNRLRTAVGEWPDGEPSAPERLERVTTGSLQSLRAYTQGMKAVNASDWTTAVELLQQATRQDAHFASAEIYLAWSLYNLGRPSDVYLPPARRAVADADQTTDRERYFILGSYSQMIGDHSKAIAYYEALVRQYPDDFWGVNNLFIEYGRSRSQERGRIGRMFLAMRPNDFTLNAMLAEDLLVSDGLDAARPYVRRARELLDAGASTIFPVARSYILMFPAHESWAVGRAWEASVHLDGAAAQPTIASDDSAQIQLGTLRLALGQLSLAGQCFERIRDPWGHSVLMAFLAFARGDFGSVITLLADAARSVPENAGRALDPVSLLVSVGALQEARQALARVTEAPDQQMQWSAAEIEEASGNQRILQAALKIGAPWTHVVAGARTFLYSETFARSAADAGQIDAAIAVLEETGRLRDKVYPAPVDTGYFWLRAQLLLTDLYRRVGRVADARTIESDLRQRLAVADADFPLLAELNRRQ